MNVHNFDDSGEDDVTCNRNDVYSSDGDGEGSGGGDGDDDDGGER